MTSKNKVQPLDDPNDREKDNPSVFVISDQTMTSYPEELRIANFRSQEILPHLDNYMISNEGFNFLHRPTIHDLLHNNPLKLKDDPESIDSKAPSSKAGQVVKLGWMQGVLMKCLLNIWGVMLYLRLTWVVGQAGLLEGLAIIGIANLVTIITATSMSAVCTNGTIKAGGIYYMISRNLGPEFGGAIGLMFFLANSIAVAMYLIGFCESLLDCITQYGDFSGITDERLNDIRIIGVVSLVAILILAITGLNWITRVQVALLALLIVSQVDFVVGTFIPPSDEAKAKGFIGYNATLMMNNLWSGYTLNEESGKPHNFFSVFAVFFPAVTGIVAGANMSGDLKDPSDAIPKGTLLAIGITCISYLSYAVLAAGCSLRAASGIMEEVYFASGMLNESDAMYGNITRRFDDCDGRECSSGLIYSQQMMEVMSAWGPLIYAGCFAATLSSAIGSLEGAPRVFQAISKDKLLPGLHYFAKGRGANNDPIRGYFLVTAIALVCLVIGKLNIVSSLLSNFFVAAYGLINFCVFHVSLTKSPSWRPKYKYYSKWLSLAGTLICVIVMFMMDWRTALATYIIIILLYVAIQKNKPDANWGSSTQSQTFLTALKGVQSLSKLEEHVKNYRPKLFVLSGDPADRPCLIDFANLITKKLSLLEFINIVPESTDWKAVEAKKASGVRWLQNNRVKAFYSVTRHSSFFNGARCSMEMSGLGKMKPNLLLIGFKNNWQSSLTEARDYYKIIQTAFDMRLSVGVLRIPGNFNLSSVSNETESLQNSVDSGNASEVNPRSSVISQDRPLWIEDDEEDVKSVGCIRKRAKPRPVLLDSSGREIRDIEVIKTMHQFRDVKEIEGFVDVYWLYDDGGLTLLMPYILITRKKYLKCKLRVFVLAQEGKNVEEETNSLKDLLIKFRINFHQIIIITDVDKRPGKKIKKDFDEMIHPFLQPKEGPPKDLSEEDQMLMLTHADMAKTSENTKFHLRIAEIVRENSDKAAMIVMTLPLPKMDNSIPFGIYMAWLDITTKNMPPFLLIRGNQDSVLTFYS